MATATKRKAATRKTPVKKSTAKRKPRMTPAETVAPEVAPVETPKVTMAYKGFDADFKCRDFQYKVGETYTHDGNVSPCNSGFHACVRPSDVWTYYGPTLARFAVVELSGKVVAGDDYSTAASSGDYSTAASSGDSSTAASSGDYSKAGAEGKDTIAMVAGLYSRAKVGDNGCIALCWHDGKRNRITTGYVGEDGIEANVWYRLDEAGKLVKC